MADQKIIFNAPCSYCSEITVLSYDLDTPLLDFACKACNKLNFICADISTKRITDISLADVEQVYELSNAGQLSVGMVQRRARAYFKDIVNRLSV